jgi:hypothetical protein
MRGRKPEKAKHPSPKIIQSASSCLHLDIAFRVFHNRRVVPRLHTHILRHQALPATTIMQCRQRTHSALRPSRILARLALALDLRRQRNDVADADLCEQCEVLVAGVAQGKPRPALLVLSRTPSFQIVSFWQRFQKENTLPLPV